MEEGNEFDWSTLLSSEVGRQEVVKVCRSTRAPIRVLCSPNALRVQILNENRTKSCLRPHQFAYVCKILTKLLDICLVEKDVKRAMQATNMGNTFFKTVVVDGEEAKEYLNSELSSHSIWQTRQFWEDALMQGACRD